MENRIVTLVQNSETIIDYDDKALKKAGKYNRRNVLSITTKCAVFLFIERLLSFSVAAAGPVHIFTPGRPHLCVWYLSGAHMSLIKMRCSRYRGDKLAVFLADSIFNNYSAVSVSNTNHVLLVSAMFSMYTISLVCHTYVIRLNSFLQVGLG